MKSHNMLRFVWFFLMLSFLLFFIFGHRIAFPDINKLQANALNERTSLYDGANIVTYHDSPPHITVKYADVLGGRFKNVFSIQRICSGLAFLILAPLLVTRKQSLSLQLCVLIFSIGFIWVLMSQFALTYSGNHAEPQVIKEKKQLIHLLNNTTKSGIAYWNQNKIFIAKETDFGINFIRISASDDNFIYVGENLNIDKLSNYCNTIRWRDRGDGIFETQHSNVARFRKNTRRGLLIFLSLFTVTSILSIVNLIKIKSQYCLSRSCCTKQEH